MKQMITLIKKSSYKESLWKNGKGLTRQIAIFPKNATVAANDFLWRISSAKVSQSDQFSHFPHCERQLVVWSGIGLLINGKPLLPNSPLTFSGEENIHCDLINDSPVVDLGIIYKKELIQASLKVLRVTTPATIDLNPGIHFLFLAIGDGCIIGENNLEVGDTLKIKNEEESEEEITISSQSHSSLTFYQFTISI
ncbi:MAG: HutD family protein [Bacteriovorax sp.]|nr:HutD family protein [Bacteriovorax sp.]